jgi:hypothetical protein
VGAYSRFGSLSVVRTCAECYVVSFKASIAFWGNEMRFLNGHDTLEPSVSGIHEISVLYFGGLKMKFLKGHEKLG